MISTILFLLGKHLYFEHYARQLITSAYNLQRPGGGRLWGTPYAPPTTVPRQLDLGRAQVLLLDHPDWKSRETLQSMLYLASGDWQTFLQRFPSRRNSNPAILNNLGVSFLALSDIDPAYLLKALDQFKQAVSVDTSALEPRFNLVLTYRKLRLPKEAHLALQKYAKLDSRSAWYSELTDDTEPDESNILVELEHVVQKHDLLEAQRLVRDYPELCRRVVMQYGLFNQSENREVVQLISNELTLRFSDRTLIGILNPLFSADRNTIINARSIVRRGATLYLHGNLNASVNAYNEALQLVEQTNSIFDRIWVDLNLVDTQIRLAQFESARMTLESVISSARQHKFAWLEAKALSVYGSTLKLTNSYSRMIHLLSEADRIFIDVGAPRDRVRPLYYLAAYEYAAGNHNEALKLALQCLQLTDDSDAIRLSSVHFLVGSILHRIGNFEPALLFEKESFEQAGRTNNASLETGAASTLAQFYESMSQTVSAKRYLGVAEDCFRRIPNSFERTKARLLLNILKARLYIGDKRYSEAESLLKGDLPIYAQHPLQVTDMISQSLLLLAQAYSETNRTSEAARMFNDAIKTVENDDQYLATEKLRLSFDDERRELYDAAIEFEFNHGSPAAAWTYVQRYRAKLFLEFLAQFNPDIDRIHSEALDQASIQRLIPRDAQVLEYVLLKDQLLIWFISDKHFTVRSVSITREALEGKVEEVLQRLRKGDDVDQLLTHLGHILIEPVADLLDPDRTIAIIPDRVLHGLPFPALRIPHADGYLIQKFSIITSPSLTHLLAGDAGQPRRDGIIGFGSQKDESAETKELTALRNIYPNVTLIAGSQVGKERFLNAMDTTPIFHYAGHSATDAVDPLRSAILLDGNRYGPNSVTAVDIAHERLQNNAVVILSSCDSSVGNSRDGVGMRGLTSAFLIGGAGSVVGSLWPVESSSTADLMILFHRAFATDQMPVAQALRQAQLAFIKSSSERSSPYYWSGFVVTGNLSALR